MQRLASDYILGIDISNHQGNVDMSQWKQAGIRFIYAKVSEGLGYTDSFFSGNVKKAKAAGIPIGGYHFARPSDNPAVKEAAFFVSLLEATPTDLDPILDLEDTNFNGTAEEMVQWVRDFVNYVTNKTGRQVMLYTGKWYADRFNGFNNALSDLRLWCARYSDPQTTTPPDFGGWTQYTAWQYTDSGKLSGVKGKVDLNYAVSLQSLGFQVKPISKPEIVQNDKINKDAAEKVIKVLESIREIGDNDVKIAAQRAADFLREKTGLPKK